MCRHCGEKNQLMSLNSHRRQSCSRNKNATSVSIPEKIYLNLLTHSTTRDLGARADPVELIWLYKAGWYLSQHRIEYFPTMFQILL
jgi:hypothetical protein